MANFILKMLKKRTTSWRTTLVGLAIMAVVFILIYLGKVTLGESFMLIMVALSLFLSDDTLFIKNFFPNKNKEINENPE